jgi:short-subunit dehydrogenase involved in D-alanine esterification of teichoic acids
VAGVPRRRAPGTCRSRGSAGIGLAFGAKFLELDNEVMRPRLATYEALCDELGEAPSDVALA